METTYKIIRKYRDMNHPDHNKTIDTGLTLEEAKAHCKDPSTSEKGVWFDCFYVDQEGDEEPKRKNKVSITRALMACYPDAGNKK